MPIGVSAAVVVILALVYFIVGGSGGSGNIIVEWSLSERDNAEILVDGESIPVANTDPLYLNVPTEGRSRLIFRRSGYKDIQKTVSSPKGTIRMKLQWGR